MGDRKFARGQKRVEAAIIMHEEGENHRIDSIRCVPPAIAKDRFAETGLSSLSRMQPSKSANDRRQQL